MKAVVVDGVWKYYGDYPALRNVSLEAPGGACLALIGRNGAGKTTLLRAIAGFSRPGKGKIEIFGEAPRETGARRSMGFIGHGISVYDELSALENLTLFGKLYQLADPRSAALEWLERTGLDRVKDALVREFSRGMRQRLALERALLHRPRLVLFDEPFTGLDDRAVGIVSDRLRALAAGGAIVVLATHDLDLADGLVNRVVLIRGGRVLSDEVATTGLRARYRALIGAA